MSVLAAVVVSLLRFRVRACVVLACISAMLCAAPNASALERVQAKTRVWDFESAVPLNVWLEGAASPRLHPGNRSGSCEVASESPHAARAGAAASKVLIRSPAQLQAKFKHAVDFGVKGNYSKANAARFSEAIHKHINSPGVREIAGKYRGNPATHFVDPQTGVNVVADSAGNFVMGYRLGAQQLQDVLTKGWLW